MFTITALYCEKGRGAMNATAESLVKARVKAKNLKSQGFFVEISNEEGHIVSAEAGE
jgi:hypothetical protein